MKTKRIILGLFILVISLAMFACGEKLSITVSGEKIVQVGNTILLKATPSIEDTSISWKSSNDSVATVTGGTVFGVSAGKVVITVTGTYGKKTAETKFEVTVAPAQSSSNEKPVIHGAVDKVIEKGTTFIPLEGITADDAEDGVLEVSYVGNVNFRVVGTYYATYTARDSDGNVTEVTIKVEVVFSDHDAPFLTGARDTNIVVGDTSFSLTDGVSAEDTVDGDLTSRIRIEGQVNVWVPGEYTVKYSVSDDSNNTKEVERKITVGFGEFKFEELKPVTLTQEGNAHSATVSGGNTTASLLADYALAELVLNVTATAQAQLQLSLSNSTSIGLITVNEGTAEYVVYFRIGQEIVNGTLEITDVASSGIVINSCSLAFGEARDEVVPTIKGYETPITLPGTVTDANVLKPFVLNGVSAQDNIDGIITSKLDVDFGNIDLGNTFDTHEVTVFVIDSSGNKTEVKRTVNFVNVYDLKLIKDPTFTEDIERASEDNKLGWSLNGGSGNPEMYVSDGVLVHHNTTNANPGWDSASSPCFRTTTDVLSAGSWYMLKFDVKAEMARKMTVRIGLDTTEALSWIENFEGANNTPFGITTEWQTCYVIFYVHANKSEAGYSSVKFELKVGTFTWGGEEQGNTVYFDNLQVYLLTNENSAPTITPNTELPTTFGKGQEKPDLTKYITAYDREDAGEIEIKPENITESIDMSKAGEYLVTYKVKDSQGKESAYVLTIKVLEEADTAAPVLTEKQGIIKEFDQFSTAPDVTSFISAVDNVDGVIVITKAMVETNANFDVAGTYECLFTVKDSSGNVATYTLTITVKDKEAPKISGKEKIRVEQGSILTADEIIASLTVTDNVDGEMTLTSANLTGLDKVDFTKPGEYNVTVNVTDANGNKAEFTKVVVVYAKSAVVIKEVLVNDILAAKPEIDSGSTGAATVSYDENGVATLKVTDVGSWASFAMMKITELGLTEGHHYVLKVTAKADEARYLAMHLGIGLYTEPWLKRFTLENDSEEEFQIGTEFAEYKVYFVFDQESEAAGPLLEFCFGQTYHTGDKAGNDIYVSQIAIYELVEEAQVQVQEELVKDILGTKPEIDSGSVGSATVEYDDQGIATINVTNVGEWASFAKMKFSDLGLEEGHHYVLKINAKADEARYLEMHIGIGLWAEPWLNRFTLENDSAELFQIGTEYAEYSVYFVYDKESQDSGPIIEFCFGQTYHDGDKAGNNIYVKDIKIYELVEKPVAQTKEELHKDILTARPGIDSGSIGSATVEYDDQGIATINVTNVGEWASFAKMKFSDLGLEEGHHYVLKVNAKADEARYLEMHIGIGLWAEPWLNRFTLENDSAELFQIGTEYAEYSVYFVYDKESQDSGPIIEFCFGQTYHDGDKAGNNIYVKDIKIYEIVEEHEGGDTPTYDENKANLSLQFPEEQKGQDFVSDDWNQYYYTTAWLETSGQMRVREKDGVIVVNMFSAYSMTYKYIYNENGKNIGLANKMTLKLGNYWDGAIGYAMKLILIDVDGNYIYLLGGPENDFYEFHVTTGLEDLSFSFADANIQSFMFICKSRNSANSFLYCGDVHITYEADSLAPVISVSDEVKAIVDAGLEFSVGTNLESTFAGLLAGLSAKDNIDGNIAITEENVDLGGLNLSNPKAGKYNIVVKVKDSANNQAKLELPVTIKGTDGEILDILSKKPDIDSGSASAATISYDENGVATVVITNVGEWASFTKMKFSNLGLEEGKYYSLKVIAKADEKRNLEMHIGIGLWADPWINYFRIIEGNKTFEIGTEFAEYEIVFQYDQTNEASGPIIEFCMGNTWHGGDKAGNNVYISKISLYEVTPTGDLVAPEVLLSSSVQSALESKVFLEGTDESATFRALLTGISAIDDVDGRITVTQDMIDLDGLVVTNLVKGKYTIKVRVSDKAGNIGMLDIPITVISEYADLKLDFKDGTVGSSYVSEDWYQECYGANGWAPVSKQMNCRETDGVRLVNMTSGYSMAYNYRYNQDGAPLGKANTLTLKAGNYWVDDAILIKIVVFDNEGNKHYVLGSTDEFYEFASTKNAEKALKDLELHFATCNVQSIQFTVRYNAQAYAYFYIGNLHLSYETDTVAPVITIDEDVRTTLSAKFSAGQDMTETFRTCMAGIHVTDNFDGNIPLALDDFDFGGLNPMLPVAGTYKVIMTVSDSQGNSANEEITITVE